MLTAILLISMVLAAHAAAGSPAVPWRVKEIERTRALVHQCQDRLGVKRSPISRMVPQGTQYRAWVLALWKARLEAFCGLVQTAERSTEVAIRVVFGRYAGEALRVSSCESGWRTWAENGQYLGTFQMGNYARSLYGHGSDALTQAKAAHAYFVASGRDWSPWSCKP